MRKILFTLLSLAMFYSTSYGQQVLSLQECRELALENNKELLITQEKITSATYSRKAAFTNYLPTVEATGSFMRNQKNLSLISNERKEGLSQLAPGAKNKIYDFAEFVGQQMPNLKPIIQGLGDEVYTGLNEFSNGLIEGIHGRSRNVYLGQISLTQPLYMGGKIRAYNKITRYTEQLAKEGHNAQFQEVILTVDQAYWQVVSLVNKESLALSYLELLNSLNQDMQHLIDEGMATKADGLSVMVKVNEAEVTLTKVQDGLNLSRMLLCQICGIDLLSPISLADENTKSFPTLAIYTDFDLEQAYSLRPEIKSLMLATQIHKQNIVVTRSEFLPKLGLSGSYLATNPSAFNGLQYKFRGRFSVGVSLSVPIWNWGRGIYKTKQARAEARISELQLDNAKEQIELQINQAAFKVNEANKKLVMTEKNLEKAEENLAHANYGFKEGVIPANNVLEAHTAWLSANSEHIDAQIDLKLTNLYFKKALGTLTND